MKTIHKMSLPMALLLSLILSSPAHAFKRYACINSAGQSAVQSQPFHEMDMYYNQNSWSNPAYLQALQESINVINTSAPDIKINLHPNGVEIYPNGYNEIYWKTNMTVPATTYSYINSNNCYIVEADIAFSTTVLWTPYKSETSLWQYGGTSRGFHNTALHEFGHALGLSHEDRKYNIMGTDWSHSHRSNSNIIPYMGADATAGLRTIYGNRSPLVQDVSLAEWEYYGAAGGINNSEYSTHIRSKITDAQDNTRPSINPRNINGGTEPYYRVSRGGDYKVYLSFENSGATNQTAVGAKYFIHTVNGNIDLATISVSVNTGDSQLRWVKIKIPTNLSIGSYYWIGATIDPDGYISESDEANTAWIGIYVEN